MKLDPLELVRRAVEFLRRESSQEPSRPGSHAERVTISAEGGEASRDAKPPVLGDVRWYRAAKRAGARGPVAFDASAGSAGAPESSREGSPARSPRAAIQAYLGVMQLPAAADEPSPRRAA